MKEGNKYGHYTSCTALSSMLAIGTGGAGRGEKGKEKGREKAKEGLQGRERERRGR